MIEFISVVSVSAHKELHLSHSSSQLSSFKLMSYTAVLMSRKDQGKRKREFGTINLPLMITSKGRAEAFKVHFVCRNNGIIKLKLVRILKLRLVNYICYDCEERW